METLQIQTNDNLSINDLVALKAQGFSVLRSAHVGNVSPYNLSLAAAGIPLLLVDHNVTGVDKNYFPELLLSQDGETRIADDGVVTSRVQTVGGSFLDEVHINGIIEALPGTDVFTNSEYLRRNERIAGEITKIALQNLAPYFERIVQSDGTTQKMNNAAGLVGSLEVLQLSNDHRAEKAAVLLPNIVDIMANFVIEQLLSERDIQYHISGPDMVIYIGSLQPELELFYEKLKREASFGARLPQTLSVQMIPAATARFATAGQFQPELLGLFAQLDDSVDVLASIARERKAFFSEGLQKDTTAKQKFITSIDKRKSAIESAIVMQAEAVPGLFVEPRQKGFITQYDVVNRGGLFVASQNKELTFRELAAVTKQLVSLRKRLRS